jgi:hypothetical protein
MQSLIGLFSAGFQKIQDQTKNEREKHEESCRTRLEKEIGKSRAEKTKIRKKSRCVTSTLQSEWKLEETLMKGGQIVHQGWGVQNGPIVKSIGLKSLRTNGDFCHLMHQCTL